MIELGAPLGFLAVRRQVRRQLCNGLVRFALTIALVAASARTTGLRAEAGSLPLPRFVSLKASSANLRVGPGIGYNIEWVFKRRSIPLEIYQEYGNWRRVRDWDGTSGWIYGPLLSGRRTGIVTPWTKDHVALHAKPAADSPVAAWLEPRVEVKLTRCDGQWCAVASGPLTGFMKQVGLWGVYPGEVL
ncbi:SH3 domain-containing protein [Mesorhizobium sp. MSK_1335]|uniref:SH3 domain-containing protein n=1 Tax=Mesorhizobium montanum TaxID=3072323 RepID=A0ABU4ZS35_9HYPH|nr:SH3 domain-containing protein [Mesorhizobium sp. MSK_1335]MDX8527815.1 SH3 domain-containing protein [Mesorhizobium sp. MSK_1335]